MQLKYSYASLVRPWVAIISLLLRICPNTALVLILQKKHERPCRLEFVGLKPGSLVHQALEKHDGFESWKVRS